MTKSNDTGVYQLKSGNWSYCYTITINGKKKDVRKAKDDFGDPFFSKREAIKARLIAIDRETAAQAPKAIVRKTVGEVYAEYRQKGQLSKAYTTIQKQNSLKENHPHAEFGKRYVDTITVSDVMDYLTELYYKQEYSYHYVEGILKIFYLIFGQVYSRNYLAVDDHNKLCVNKDTKIKMPKAKSDEDADIMAFRKEELLLWMAILRELMRKQFTCWEDTAAFVLMNVLVLNGKMQIQRLEPL